VPVSIVAHEIVDGTLVIKLDDDSFIRPILLPNIAINDERWAVLAPAPGHPTVALKHRVGARSAGPCLRPRPLHRSLISPRRWAERRFYRGLR
jgi:hypothetical protein